MLEKIKFEYGEPVAVTLRHSAGKIVSGRFGEQVYYTLAAPANTCMYLDLNVAQQVNMLEPQAGDTIVLCKHSKGNWQAWLSPETEKMRAAKETTPLERQLAGTMANIAEGRPPAAPRPQPMPATFAQRLNTHPELGTGTNGPVAVPAAAPAPALPAALQGWSAALLDQTNALVDVYAQACKHAEKLNVPAAVVRTVMISAFIGLQRGGGNRG